MLVLLLFYQNPQSLHLRGIDKNPSCGDESEKSVFPQEGYCAIKRSDLEDDLSNPVLASLNKTNFRTIAGAPAARVIRVAKQTCPIFLILPDAG